MEKRERKKLISETYAKTCQRRRHPLFGSVTSEEMTREERRELIKNVSISVAEKKAKAKQKVTQ